MTSHDYGVNEILGYAVTGLKGHDVMKFIILVVKMHIWLVHTKFRGLKAYKSLSYSVMG